MPPPDPKTDSEVKEQAQETIMIDDDNDDDDDHDQPEEFDDDVKLITKQGNVQQDDGQQDGESEEQEEPPFPTFKVILIALSLFANAYCITVLFPFLPYMILDISDANYAEEAGNYAGFVAGAFFLGRLLFSYPWGTFSDKFGRKIVVVLGNFFNFVCILLFGMSTTLPVAIITRFLTGALAGGVVGTVKAVLAEICIGKKNNALGMSTIGATWGMGLVVGSSIGGLLAQPVSKYPEVFGDSELFKAFPYLLPCIVGALLSGTATILYQIFMPETSTRASHTELTMHALVHYCLPNICKTHHHHHDRNGNGTGPDGEQGDFNELQERDPEDNSDSASVSSIESDPEDDFSFISMYRRKKVFAVVNLYVLLSFYTIMFDELYPLWAILPTNGGKGGLNFHTQELGVSLATTGVATAVFQLYLYPKVAAKLGPLQLFRYGSLALAPCSFVVPFMSYLSLDTVSTTVMWTVLITYLIIRSVLLISCFTSTFILVNNSEKRIHLGSVHGISQTMASLARTVAPIMAGTSLAWSLSNGIDFFPLDIHFAFVLITIVAIIQFSMTYQLDDTINSPYEDQ